MKYTTPILIFALGIVAGMYLMESKSRSYPTCQKYGYSDRGTVVMNMETDRLLIECKK
jgi:hypothetical protein